MEETSIPVIITQATATARGRSVCPSIISLCYRLCQCFCFCWLNGSTDSLDPSLGLLSTLGSL